MVPPLMLLCKNGDHTIVFKVVSNSALKDLTDFLSCKLKKFDSSGCILLSYCLPGHLQCMIDNDSDFQNMLSLVYPLGVDQVDVTITEMGISNETHGVRESRDASGSNITDDEMDLLHMNLHDEHTCGAAVRTSKNSRMSSNLVTSLIVNEVRGNPQTCPIDVVRQFTDQYGLTITYNHAWLGVEKARTTTFGDFSMSHDEIRWYIDIVMSTNTGNYLRLDYNHGSRGFFPLAMAIVDTETTNSWEWFFMHLSNILLDKRPITFISDRNAGLLEALPKCLKELQDEGKGIVCRFLSNFPYDKWTNANFKGKKYGEMHSNVAESFNSWIHQARHLPTTKMIDSIRLKIMDLMLRRREQAKKWNTFLCPEMDSTLVNALKSG
ncbi:uncharacterized protein LOC114261161 [Camellia sinensis]|uniref:uncharacterized protein LOC114261161 n=1 Tax=Camellia sinensis TaxID=4442 RepID=UPI0010363547|nr:uncharacterized protein LOC114261161 [Camellia sinensis]